MGRRSLRKIDPVLDISHWLVPEDELPTPLDVGSLFGHTASPEAVPLEIEVGTGKGLFLMHATAAQPDHLFLGIELAGSYARFAAARLAKLNVANGKVVHGDGARVFQQRIPDACVYAVHVYFPDPWWKKRHRKRRIMTTAFVRDVHRVLQPGGILHFWTDVKEYFDSTLTIIAATSTFPSPEFPAAIPAEHDLDYRTHFERRMRLNNLPVYRALFRKQVC